MVDKEILREQLITFMTAHEVCAMLKVDVERLLYVFDDEFNELLESEEVFEDE